MHSSVAQDSVALSKPVAVHRFGVFFSPSVQPQLLPSRSPTTVLAQLGLQHPRGIPGEGSAASNEILQFQKKKKNQAV